jgi:glycine/D-amino acid oxidase-like deaminating enzyme
MRICVIGAGLFGATAAIYAARAGHEVHLLEARDALMAGATASTFSRLHRGAHYPRSPATGRESRRAEKSFRAEYGSAVVDGGIQCYMVPDHGSHVTVAEFRDFLDNEGLYFSEDNGVFTVEEPRVHLRALSELVRMKVAQAGVNVHLGCRINWRTARDLRDKFDRIIVAAYANMNDVLGRLDCPLTEYKYQVVERPVVLLPREFRETSIVVIDGPFGCLDPLDETGMHILGHVTESIHASNVGYRSYVPAHLASVINQGVISNPEHTRFREIVDGLAQYVPGVKGAVHVGSSYTVRAVLAHQEATDRRPTLVQACDAQVSTIFSGKLSTCVAAARTICDSLANVEREVA